MGCEQELSNWHCPKTGTHNREPSLVFCFNFNGVQSANTSKKMSTDQNVSEMTVFAIHDVKKCEYIGKIFQHKHLTYNDIDEKRERKNVSLVIYYVRLP